MQSHFFHQAEVLAADKIDAVFYDVVGLDLHQKF